MLATLTDLAEQVAGETGSWRCAPESITDPSSPAAATFGHTVNIAARITALAGAATP